MFSQKLSKHENTVIATYRVSHWLIQRVPSSSSGWLGGGGGGGGGGREPLIWCLILTLNSPSSPTRPSHYVVGDIAGSQQLFRVPGTNNGHLSKTNLVCFCLHTQQTGRVKDGCLGDHTHSEEVKYRMWEVRIEEGIAQKARWQYS